MVGHTGLSGSVGSQTNLEKTMFSKPTDAERATKPHKSLLTS